MLDITCKYKNKAVKFNPTQKGTPQTKRHVLGRHFANRSEAVRKEIK
jgi:hypothetical protein